jgi:outer membrane protein OmpA-like peptidoglycan-associated protein/Tol biopolymer transport system component
MKNKMYVRQSALVAGLCGLVASLAVVGAPAAQVGASAPTNGPLHYSIGAGATKKSFSLDGQPVTLPSSLTSAPFYSTDGTKMAWVEIIMGANVTSNVYVANADGTDQKKLLTHSRAIDKPQFSADKSKVLVYSGDTADIYSIDATIENQTLGAPIVSTNGGMRTISVSVTDKIAYTEYDTNKCIHGFFVSVSNLDGTGASIVPGTCAADQDSFSVQWNADGTQMFVAETDRSTGSNIYRIIRRGLTGSPTTISTLSERAAALALSPDGTKLAYATVVYSTPLAMELSTINIDGTGVTTVVTNSDSLRELSWGIPIASSGGSATTTVPATTVPANGGADSAVVPGVTVTDTKVYTRAPRQVAASSAITVLTRAQTRTRTIESNTPSVCLPTNDDIVFIDEGRCSVSILSKKTGRVLKRLSTRVIEDEVSNLEVGNEIAVIAPIYFDGASNDVNARGLRRIRGLVPRISAAGTVLVVGHSGIALGDTPENRSLSRQRAVSTVNAIKKAGGKGPFSVLGVGGKSPLVASTRGEDQAKNRRVVIVLVP